MASSTPKYSLDKKKPGKTKAFFICLLIAAFLWVVHSLNTVYVYNLKIPVSFKNIPRNKKPQVHLPDSLNVDIKASGLRLGLILLNRPFKPMEVDFNNLKSVNRNQNYVLSFSHLDFKKVLHFETQVKHISPDTLYFSEKVGFQKNVPVKVPMYIKCEPGFGHKMPQVTPAFITIWGDTALLEKVDTIYTQPITLTNLSKNLSTQLDLLRPSTEVFSAVNEINVFIEVDRLIQQSIILPIINERATLPGQVQFFPTRTKVIFTSLQNSFNPNDTTAFKAMIDSEKINHSNNKSPIYLKNIPSSINIIELQPKEVELLIFRKK